MPEVELIQSLVLFLMVADVGSDRPLVPSYRVDEKTARPEVLPHEIALPFAVDARQVNRALALDKPTTCDTAYFGGIEIIM